MYELRAKSSKETDILMYGSISEWGRVRAEDLFNKLTDAKAKGYEKVNLKINSPGGSIFEGIAIMSQMTMQDIVIVGTVEGIAASMASAMLQGCHERRMVKGGRMMVHQGSGGVFGSSNYIRNYADLLDSLNKTLSEIYAKRTKKDAKWILDNWMGEGKDTWFTAEQALKEGLIDKIVDGHVKPIEKEQASLLEMAAHYASQLDTTENEMNKEQLIKLLGLNANATDAEITAALTAMKAKADAAPAPQQAAQPAPAATKDADGETKKLLAESVAEMAKAKGMTDEKQLAAIKKVAEFDVKAALDLITASPAATTSEKKEEPAKPVATINDLLTAMKGGSNTSVATDRKDWTYEKWSKEDSKGLLAMAKEKPGEYAKLFAAEHGYTPTEDEIKKLVA